MPIPILLIISFPILLILIGKQFLVKKQDVLFLTDERHARSIFAALIYFNAQQLCHLVLIVYEITPFRPSLEHNLQALT